MTRSSKKYLVSLAVLLVALYIWQKPMSSATNISALAKPVLSDHKALSAQLIPQDDLPPVGTRSLFDHLIVENDGLPYPFEKLAKMLTALDADGHAPVSVLIPNGRSLLKAQANAAHPRVLLAADFQLGNKPLNFGLAPRGQLFLGFVENAHEIEVLSYNEGAGRFEFQLVQNYCAGCVPRIVYARRAICTTCHQGGGPIFPQRPWNETNGQQATAASIIAARGNNQPYFSVPIQQPLAAPERFDQLTDMGNFINTSQRLWLDGCGLNGNDCRRLMFKLALRYADSPGSFDEQQADVRHLVALQARHFPVHGIVVNESDLLNRDPLGDRQGFKGWWHSLWTREPKPGEGAKNNEDLAAFDKLPKLAAEFDPLSLRAPKHILHAQDVDGVYGLAALFTDADIQRLSEHAGHNIKRLEAQVDALPETEFSARPFSRIRFLQALLGVNIGYCCLSTQDMSPPIASGVAPLKIVKEPILHHFESYCFACHRGNPAKRLNFMAGNTEGQVLASIRDKSEIRDALDWERYTGTDKANKLMPPRDSVQYARLEAAGEQGVKAREAMRAAVPSLFGF